MAMENNHTRSREVTNDQESNAEPPRKRRRRTATSGAADDCFTCRKRSIACDRKRPYCTQCIHIGKECSGYKTTLTWGVGVASRGKLRGQSYPIAKSKPDGDKETSKRREERKSQTISEERGQPARPHVRTDSTAAQSIPSPPVGSRMPYQLPLPVASPPMTNDMPPSVDNAGAPGAPAHSNWQSSSQAEMVQLRPYNPGHEASAAHFERPSLQPISSAVDLKYQYPPHAMTSAPYPTMFQTNSPVQYHTSPTAIYPPYRPPFETTSYPNSAASLFHDAQQHVDEHHPYIDTYNRGTGVMDNTMSIVPTGNAMMNLTDPALQTPLASDAIVDSYFGSDFQFEDLTELEEQNMMIWDPRFGTTFFHVSPRVRTLMDYYDQHVCPYLVAFDGPDNPYRKHILQLAYNSPGLQNAIAALATNNLRMRQEIAPRESGFVEEIQESSIVRSKNDATPEELLYKKLSIDQLNARLKDGDAAQDDSVLASLLILCLFNVCDAGFSKFKTQLAGMQKLLSMRSGETDFTRMVQMFFAWFDTMTSTVNDREMQIRGEPLDLLNYATNLGALEQFSGCDGRLFKLIARLGRLNLLAQGRAVRPITPSSASDSNLADSNPPIPDSRTEFWLEWHDIRTRLTAWQPSTQPPLNSPHDPLPGSRRFSGTASDRDVSDHDLLHINETFRHAALLYTTRLGWPLLPSSHPRLQALVEPALRIHVAALPLTSPMNKFLLWPLFILGTECVDPLDRDMVRLRCMELSKESGFYNNLSGLEVLERVWRNAETDGLSASSDEGVVDVGEAEARVRRESLATDVRTGSFPQAFRWRRAMDRVDGEYIVI